MFVRQGDHMSHKEREIIANPVLAFEEPIKTEGVSAEWVRAVAILKD